MLLGLSPVGNKWQGLVCPLGIHCTDQRYVNDGVYASISTIAILFV